MDQQTRASRSRRANSSSTQAARASTALRRQHRCRTGRLATISSAVTASQPGWRAGTVNVNDAYAAAWGSMDAPMGGMKASGIGRRHGEHGIVKYTESQTIAVERLLPVGVPDGVNPARYARLATAGLRLLKRMPGVR